MNAEQPNDSDNVDMSSVFVSHTGLDGAYVAKLVSRLEGEGVKCWYYERDNFGSSIGTAVDKALDECGYMLFVMSRNLPEASTYVQNELNEYVRTRRKIIPLRVSMPDKWWPLGTRSLIGSFPVVEDSSGYADATVIEEIKRRIVKTDQVPNVAENNSPSHMQRFRKKRSLPTISASLLVVAALLVVFFASIGHNGDKHFNKEIERMLEDKTRKMPGFLKLKWVANLKAIEEIEQRMDESDARFEKSLESQRWAELRQVDATLDSYIRQEAPVFKLQHSNNNGEPIP